MTLTQYLTKHNVKHTETKTGFVITAQTESGRNSYIDFFNCVDGIKVESLNWNSLELIFPVEYTDKAHVWKF